jgi:hypothetical protein
MKTHTHYTTPVMLAPRRWRGMLMLVGLIELVVIAVVVLYALGWLDQAPGAIAERPARPLIARCRVCADEALGTYQAARPIAAPVAQARAPQGLIARCRVCADEALSPYANFGPADDPAVFLQPSDQRPR